MSDTQDDKADKSEVVIDMPFVPSGHTKMDDQWAYQSGVAGSLPRQQAPIAGSTIEIVTPPPLYVQPIISEKIRERFARLLRERVSAPDFSPASVADITRNCVEAQNSFSRAASSQALWEALSADMERRVNDVRAEMGQPSLRESARQKAEAPPASPSFRSPDEMMDAVRSLSKLQPL